MAEKKKVTFYLGTGRRKTAVARVRVSEGKGTILINERPLEEFFSEAKDKAAVLAPLVVTDQTTRLDVTVRVEPKPDFEAWLADIRDKQPKENP